MYYHMQLKNYSNNKSEQLKLTTNHIVSIIIQPKIINILMEGHEGQVILFITMFWGIPSQMKSPRNPMEAFAPNGTPV